jgi:hypothetical protein
MGYLDVVILLASATFYYRLGDSEYGRGWMTGGLSLGLGVGAAYGFGGGTWVFLAAQVLFYVALTVMNFFRKP